jgi:spore coat protein A, manganese oxidase
MAGMSRRHFIVYGLGTGAALALPGMTGTQTASAVLSPKLRKYVQPLPVPGQGIEIASPVGGNRYAFTQRQIRRQLHPQLPPTPIWAYDDGSGLQGQAGSFGMAVVAHSGVPVRASFTSELPVRYPAWIPVDTRLTVRPDKLVRALTHLHGGFVAADSDGNPAVTINGFSHGQTQHVYYPNQRPQMPATLSWFHDHAFGATRLGVFAGLAAAYQARTPDIIRPVTAHIKVENTGIIPQQAKLGLRVRADVPGQRRLHDARDLADSMKDVRDAGKREAVSHKPRMQFPHRIDQNRLI